MPISAQALDILLVYGFPKNTCKRALNAVGGSSVSLALDWIEKNQDDPGLTNYIDVEVIDMKAD